MANFPLSGPYDVQYRFNQFRPQQLMYIKGIVGTLLGTHASDASILDLTKIPANSNITITGVTCKVSGGGTGAATAPKFAILQSLAGTGAVSEVASAVWGTRADGDWVTMTLATAAGVDVPAGNVVSFGAIAGTVAETNEIINDICIEYKVDWT